MPGTHVEHIMELRPTDNILRMCSWQKDRTHVVVEISVFFLVNCDGDCCVMHYVNWHIIC